MRLIHRASLVTPGIWDHLIRSQTRDEQVLTIGSFIAKSRLSETVVSVTVEGSDYYLTCTLPRTIRVVWFIARHVFKLTWKDKLRQHCRTWKFLHRVFCGLLCMAGQLLVGLKNARIEFCCFRKRFSRKAKCRCHCSKFWKPFFRLHTERFTFVKTKHKAFTASKALLVVYSVLNTFKHRKMQTCCVISNRQI